MSQDLRRPPPRKSSLAASEPIALLNATRNMALERVSRTGTRFSGSATARIRGSGSDSEGLSNETPGDEEEEEEEEDEEEEEEEDEDEMGRGRRKGFTVKAAFLLTPSRELTIERATGLCERMRLRCPFSLSRTATGILFKFADADDFKAVFRKGFHRVTGARRYWKVMRVIRSGAVSYPKDKLQNLTKLGKHYKTNEVALPCRPLRAYAVLVLDVPEEVPIEDIRFALRPKFPSVIDVVRLKSMPGPQVTKKNSMDKGGAVASAAEAKGEAKKEEGEAEGGGGEMGEEEEEEDGEEKKKAKATDDGREKTTANAVLSVRPSHAKTPITATASAADPTPPPPVRVTMTSQEEANILLQVGLDFYGATHFPTEAPPQGKKKSVGGGVGVGRGGAGGKASPGVGTITSYDWGPGTVRRRVRELLPVFDSRFAAASERKVKPRSQ